uniref:Uncharacterized protein n=1 Tax=Arundo donax TaxID=35708 RepID=A0A0A9ETH3_ARUDO
MYINVELLFLLRSHMSLLKPLFQPH